MVAGGTPSKKNVGYWEKGTIKWLGSTVCQNQKNIENITGYITEKGLAESSTKLMKKGTTLIALVGATIGKRAFLPFEAAINQNIAGIYPKNTHELNPSYVYYACALLYPKFLALTQGSKLAMANISFVRSLEIPVPSVRIQNRIVHVLDNFDAICSDLNIGLPAEIEARQKQYEYYRDMLLTFAESGNTISRAEQSRAEQSALIKLLQYVFGYVALPLAEIFDTRNGYTPSKSKKEFWDSADIPWFRMEDIRENGRILSEATQYVSNSAVKGKAFPEKSIIISTSATIGEHALINVPFLANQRFTCLMMKKEYKDILDIEYLFYYCFKLDNFCREHLNQGNFASVDMKAFNTFEFCIPSIEKQKETASILKRFDTLCNDLSEGLPAEIEARRKQYEYYRDKLLSFKELQK